MAIKKYSCKLKKKRKSASIYHPKIHGVFIIFLKQNPGHRYKIPFYVILHENWDISKSKQDKRKNKTDRLAIKTKNWMLVDECRVPSSSGLPPPFDFFNFHFIFFFLSNLVEWMPTSPPKSSMETFRPRNWCVLERETQIIFTLTFLNTSF